MIFCKFGRLLAKFAVGFGLVLAGMGFTLALNGSSPEPYWPGKTTGQVIDKGLWIAFQGLVVGMVAEIGLALNKSTR